MAENLFLLDRPDIDLGADGYAVKSSGSADLIDGIDLYHNSVPIEGNGIAAG